MTEIVTDADIQQAVTDTLAREGGRAARSGDTTRLNEIMAEVGAISNTRSTPGNSLGLKFG